MTHDARQYDKTPGRIRWRWELLDQTDSTNQEASQRVVAHWQRGERPEGIVVMARRQRAGRGQHGRTWESPEGGLYMSAVVEGETVPATVRDRLALVAGVAVAEAMEAEGVSAKIRWPNDLVLGDKKVAGILCEALAQGEKWAAVVGIGVNVNTPVERLPAALQAQATSLWAEDGQDRSPEALSAAIVARLGQWLSRVRERGLVGVIERVRALDGLCGRRVRFQTADELFEARVAGIDDAGRLILRKAEHGKESMGPAVAYGSGSVLGVFPT